MSLEIERKFLVKETGFLKNAVSSVRIVQGYLSDNESGIVRVRIAGDKAFLTIKSRTVGVMRHEWEYQIPLIDAEEMLSMPGVRQITKLRYYVAYDGLTWEVDVFEGNLKGLILAEIEFEDENTKIHLPDFIGREVTNDVRYFNSSLVIAQQVPSLTD
ncbi:MAG: CYTH domain-containing protein [Muribaculaceae bacterium]|nr:CYTH domain-containing protein [Muribaculaceae bacterium]